MRPPWIYALVSEIRSFAKYINPFPAKLIIEHGIVRTENSNKPHGFGPILESRLESGLANEILTVLKNKPLGKSEIAATLGHQSTSSGLHKQVKRLLMLGLIEMTFPEKPNSRLQKYRLKN